jgi:hypothetical protein
MFAWNDDNHLPVYTVWLPRRRKYEPSLLWKPQISQTLTNQSSYMWASECCGGSPVTESTETNHYCTEAGVRSSQNGGNDRARGFLRSAICTSFQPPLACQQEQTLVAWEYYDMVIPVLYPTLLWTDWHQDCGGMQELHRTGKRTVRGWCGGGLSNGFHTAAWE